VFGLASGAAWAFWVTSSTSGSNGSAAATSVNSGATPTVTSVGTTATLTWTAATLATGQAVSGYQIKRYDAATLVQQAILPACNGTVNALTCTETGVPLGTWRYSVTPVFATNWLGAESAKTSPILIETTPPVNVITLSGITGGAWKSGNTIYYAGGNAGSFTLTNAVTDAGSGPASSQTAALGGVSTGWTHSPSTVSSPAGGPYVSNVFSWAAATSSGPTEAVTGRDVGGNTAATTLTLVNDATAPGMGTITYANGYQVAKSVAVAFTTGTDPAPGSGINTRQLQRATAALTAGICGAFGAFANLGPNNPTSPYTDTALSNAKCYQYRYVVTDMVGNQSIATNANIARVDYAGAVSATAGLLSYWRLGESAATLTASDSFTDAAATALTAHTGEIGATWTTAGGVTEQISSENRARRNGGGYSLMYASATPASANYSVEADLYVKSNLTGDMDGVVGRLNTATTSYYIARWQRANTSWNILEYTNGFLTGTVARVTGQPLLTVGDNYHLELEMVGTTLTLYVNGVFIVSGTDATLSLAGKAGIMDGEVGATAVKDDTVGLHLDNFQVTPSTYPRAADSKGTNTGDYKNGVTLGGVGALPNDTNTSAQFDGVNEYVQMTGTTGLPTGAALRSTELWFKTTSAARQVLFTYGSSGNQQQYGLWLDAGGTTMTAWGYGGAYDKVFTMPAALNDGNWHYVVKTYNGTAVTLYIDGVALTPQTVARATAVNAYGFSIGAVLTSDPNYGGYFNGSIDEVSFYTTTLNQATVTNHYALGTAP
jgi:hypothetical protein